MFNEAKYLERAEAGEITVIVIHDGTPSQEMIEALKLPPGTKSQTLSYRINNSEIARAHQFLLPDGKLAASGKPDPKRILRDGILYRLKKAPKPPSD